MTNLISPMDTLTEKYNLHQRQYGNMHTPKVPRLPPDIVREQAASSVSVTETYFGGLAKTLNPVGGLIPVETTV